MCCESCAVRDRTNYLDYRPVGAVVYTEHRREWTKGDDGMWSRPLESGEKVWTSAKLAASGDFVLLRNSSTEGE